MKIALIGYGKMGQAIEKLATARGHTIVAKATSKAPVRIADLADADVAIEFTEPSSALKNIHSAFQSGTPIVVGTTGWYNQLDEVKGNCAEANGALFYASNFSIGVNLFQSVLKYTSELMKNYAEYTPSIHEIHHLAKKDAPSGTALSLADIVLDNSDFEEWTDDDEDQTKLKISSERIGDVKGTHEVHFTSSIDQITLEHKAFSRDGFALGSILAAEWVQKKKGVFTMRDMLKNTIR